MSKDISHKEWNTMQFILFLLCLYFRFKSNLALFKKRIESYLSFQVQLQLYYAFNESLKAGNWNKKEQSLLDLTYLLHKIFLLLITNCLPISSYSFRENYSFLNLEIVANSNSFRDISIFYFVNWIFAVETIQGRKLFKGGSYMRKYDNCFQWISKRKNK